MLTVLPLTEKCAWLTSWARLRAGAADAHAVDDVVEAALEQGEHVLTRDALHAVRHLIILAELAFLHAVDALGLLLLAQLQAVFGDLFAGCAVRAGRDGTLFERAFGRIAAVALQKEFCTLSAAETAFGISICCHRSVLLLLYSAALRGPATVVRDGRNVGDQRDLEIGRGERADGRLSARARAFDIHFDRTQAVLFRDARGGVGRGLRRERRALTRALKAQAARARTTKWRCRSYP